MDSFTIQITERGGGRTECAPNGKKPHTFAISLDWHHGRQRVSESQEQIRNKSAIINHQS